MARWRRVFGFVQAVFFTLRKSRQRTVADLTVGLLHSRRVGLAHIARGMVDRTQVKGRVKRVGRFLANGSIRPWEVTRHLVEALMPSDRESVVAVDWTALGDYQVLKASRVFRRRALPLAWRVVDRWHWEESQNRIEEELILTLASVIGPQRRWVLVADRGFGRTELFRTLDEAGVPYVIRVSGTAWMEHKSFSGQVWNLPRRVGHSRTYRDVLYHQTQRWPVTLVVSHQEPAPEPWWLVTNLDAPARRVGQLYAKRMGIEEGIRDCKSGLGLKSLWLSEPERVERMLILVAVALLLIALTAAASIRRGESLHLSTSKQGHRVLSYFTLGCRILEAYPRRLSTNLRHLSAI